MADERDFPDVDFVETDTAAMIAEAEAAFESEFGRKLHPADPERLRLLWYLSITSQTRSMINVAAKRNLPRYADGEFLDSLAELFYGVQRQAAIPATTVLEFSLSMMQDVDIIVPEGTEVTTEGGEIVFTTVDDLTIQAGMLTGSVAAECETDGTGGNGYEAGLLNTMIDPVPYVESVRNTDTSAGGEDDEDDASLYERMKGSLEAYSTAGTAGAYRYHAMEHNPAVDSVVITTPEAGCVDVTMLLSGGRIPGEDVLEEMQEYLRSDEIRALTDYVTVSAPQPVPFNVEVTYYTEVDSTDGQDTVEAAVQKAVSDYVEWQTRKLGRRINPSKLVALIVAAGAGAVDVIQPTAHAVGEREIGQCGNISITYGGVDG